MAASRELDDILSSTYFFFLLQTTYRRLRPIDKADSELTFSILQKRKYRCADDLDLSDEDEEVSKNSVVTKEDDEEDAITKATKSLCGRHGEKCQGSEKGRHVEESNGSHVQDGKRGFRFSKSVGGYIERIG